MEDRSCFGDPLCGQFSVFALTPQSIGGWLFLEWIFVGPTEEIPFRGLLQTFLMQRTSGRIRLWKYDIHVAGVTPALLFELARLMGFWTENLWVALGQQIYAFALGILMPTGMKSPGVCWLRVLDIA